METTSTDHRGDEVIELAMASRLRAGGRGAGVQEPFHGYHAPTRPIPAGITALAGIGAGMVARCRLDTDAVVTFVAPAVIMLAHKTDFDRRFFERLHP